MSAILSLVSIFSAFNIFDSIDYTPDDGDSGVQPHPMDAPANTVCWVGRSKSVFDFIITTLSYLADQVGR